MIWKEKIIINLVTVVTSLFQNLKCDEEIYAFISWRKILKLNNNKLCKKLCWQNDHIVSFKANYNYFRE